VGVTPTQIVEAVFRTARYAGHPRPGNGLRIVKEGFAERNIDPTDKRAGS
jgi:alkylhydroperoxidase/carboxymuconolactone decarboxylase family protein YurZ